MNEGMDGLPNSITKEGQPSLSPTYYVLLISYNYKHQDIHHG